MELLGEPLPGAHLLRLKQFGDKRGTFVKTYVASTLRLLGIEFDLREEFYSFSKAGVVRGMHFQTPPFAHDKLVHCAAGAVEDVLVDLRRGPGYGRVAVVRLDAAAPALLTIPVGVAHGFAALVDDSLMIYKTSTEHAPSHDRGVRWDSFGHAWPFTKPVVSERDQGHPALANFVSPF